MKTILVVDDEPKIAELARDYLEHAGFTVRTAGDGDAALAAVRRDRPDLVVLDLGLPGLDGLDVTRAIRRDSNLPVIMLTARDDELDKLLGLELGADDYLTKPFSPRELVARVKAVLRRVDAGRQPELGNREVIRAGDLTLDLPRMRTEIAGRPGRSRPLVREPVANALDGQDVAGLAWVGLELAADVLDVRVDCPLVRLERDAVDGVEEL